MKRLLCSAVLAVLTAACGVANAQNLWIGLRGGPSIPRLSEGGNEISSGYESILAPNFGIMAEFFLAEHFSVQSEINYSGQGGARNGLQPITIDMEGIPQLPPGQYLYGDFKNKSILNYLEIPIMGKYHWEASPRRSYFVEGGPYIGFLLNATQETRNSSLLYTDKNRTPLTIEGQALPPVSFNADTDTKNDLNKVNAGITAGFGTAYQVSPSDQVFLESFDAPSLLSITPDVTT